MLNFIILKRSVKQLCICCGIFYVKFFVYLAFDIYIQLRGIRLSEVDLPIGYLWKHAHVCMQKI